MARDGYISIVNLAQFQHYKERTPPWIKLHTALLEKYEYQRLPDASKSHLTGLWMLASRLENKIPNDPEWIAQRIGATSIVNVQVLVDAGFVEITGSRASKPLALRLRDDCPETEAEGEGKTETQEKAGAASLAPVIGSIEPEPESESAGTWYGRVLKPILYRPPLPTAAALHDMQSRDISVLGRQLKSRSRADIEAAALEVREQAEDGQLTGWIEPGQTFTLRALVSESNGGIQTFERFRHAAVKRRELGGAA